MIFPIPRAGAVRNAHPESFGFFSRCPSVRIAHIDQRCSVAYLMSTIRLGSHRSTRRISVCVSPPPAVDAPVHEDLCQPSVGIHHDPVPWGRKAFSRTSEAVYSLGSREPYRELYSSRPLSAPCMPIHRIQQPEGILAPDVGERHVAYIADGDTPSGRVSPCRADGNGVPEVVI